MNILFLGGSYAQVPIIKAAKNRGFYIITCDYLPGNPGHKLADEYYNISTTDLKGVLNLARKLKPECIIGYASDPAAPVAAFVSEQLGLPTNSYESVRILSEKNLFRFLLSQNGFNTPDFITIEEEEDAESALNYFKFPYILKPTDSSGSKGVSLVCAKTEVDSAVKSAFSFSRTKRIIAEEYIDNKIADLHGDGFVLNGKLIFSLLGDHIYNSKVNPFNPIGTLWPSKHSKEIIETIENDVARILEIIGFKNGPINIEARVSSTGKPYIMEIGPRNGGHFVPQAIEYATGFSSISATLDLLSGENIVLNTLIHKYSAYYAIHSESDGVLLELALHDDLDPFVMEFHQYISPGQRINKFKYANDAIGILIMKFDDRDTMENTIMNIDKLINLKINAVSS